MEGILVLTRLTGLYRGCETYFPNRARAAPHIDSCQAFVIGIGRFYRGEYFLRDCRLPIVTILAKQSSKFS